MPAISVEKDMFHRTLPFIIGVNYIVKKHNCQVEQIDIESRYLCVVGDNYEECIKEIDSAFQCGE